MTPIDLAAVDAEWGRIRSTYLKPDADRPPSTARGP